MFPLWFHLFRLHVPCPGMTFLINRNILFLTVNWQLWCETWFREKDFRSTQIMWRKMCRHWWMRRWKSKWRTRLYSWSRTHIARVPTHQYGVKLTRTLSQYLLSSRLTSHRLLPISLLPICGLLLNQFGLLQQLIPDSLQRLTALLCLLLQKIQHLFLPALNAIHHHCRCTVNLPHARDLILKRPLFLLHNLHPPHHGFHLPWQLHHCLAKIIDWFCFLNPSLQIKIWELCHEDAVFSLTHYLFFSQIGFGDYISNAELPI